MRPARDLFSYRKYWAQRFGTAPFLPTSRAEMDALGWDSCDVVVVTGDACVDHPSFGMAIVGRVLEAFKDVPVVIESPEDVKELAQHHVGGDLKIAKEAFEHAVSFGMTIRNDGLPAQAGTPASAQY